MPPFRCALSKMVCSGTLSTVKIPHFATAHGAAEFGYRFDIGPESGTVGVMVGSFGSPSPDF